MKRVPEPLKAELLRRLRVSVAHPRQREADPFDVALAIQDWLRWFGLDEFGWKACLHNGEPAVRIHGSLERLAPTPWSIPHRETFHNAKPVLRYSIMSTSNDTPRSVPIRVPIDLHRAAKICASTRGLSLQAFAAAALEREIQRTLKQRRRTTPVT